MTVVHARRSAGVSGTAWLGAVLVALALAGCGADAPTDPGDPGAGPAGVPAALAFITDPGDAVAGEPLATAIRVEVRDADGARVGDAEIAITLALASSPEGAALEGTTTVTSTSGVAAFSGLFLEKAAAGYTLAATASELASATSAPFTVAPAAPAELVLLTEPGTAEGQVPFDPAIEVAIVDAFGNVVTDATDDVSIALSVTPTGEALGGTTTVAAAGGVARFDDLTLARPGDGFVLEATSGDLPAVASVAFSVRTPFVQTSAAVSGTHTCGITSAGYAYCWGYNSNGQLGDGTERPSDVPTPVAGGLRFTQVDVAGFHTCGLTPDGAAYCWGYNANGQLGDGSSEDRAAPAPVVGGLRFALVSVGESHSCGLTADGSAHCWGSDQHGQRGDGDSGLSGLEPRPVAGGLTFSRLNAGSRHTCAVATDDAAYCWGANIYGELGVGGTTARDVPTPVAGGLRFAQLSAGNTHTCGVTTDGFGYCWGENRSGRLGDGTTEPREVPARVDTGLTFAGISAGSAHTCAVTAGDIAYCWGHNSTGSVGDGSTTERVVPTPVAGGLSFSSVEAGNAHACGIVIGSGAYCWGTNWTGQLGDGTNVDRLVPTRVVQ